jgi:hypothetical protein
MATVHGLRSHGWFVGDDLVLAGGSRVDHVLVGPAGVLVVQRMRSDEPAGDGPHGRPPVRARVAARRLQHELAVRELPVEVVPAVLAGGPGQPDVPGGVKVIDNVAYLFEDAAGEWLEHLAGRRLLDDGVVEAVRGVVAELMELVAVPV